MANRRMINSDLFSDDVFMELDDLTRLVWIGLIVMSADDQGRLQDNELLVKSQIFPMDNKAPAKIKASLDILEHHDMIYRYQKGDKKLIQIVNWWKHQSPSWASASAYPAPDNWVDREKYHAVGNKVVTTNWDTSGGFSKLHTSVHSQLPTGVSRLIDESEVKNTIKSDVKNENTYENTRDVETPVGGTFPSSDNLSSVCNIYKEKTGKLDPKDAAMLKDLTVAYGVSDIGRAIEHMVAHTERPNGAYLRTILDGWYQEKKIRKVYA